MDIAWLDFLQLDQCESHGIWFDAGELQRALDGDIVPEEVARIVKQASRVNQKK